MSRAFDCECARPGGGHCPSFVPRSFVKHLHDNAGAVEVISLVTDVVAQALISSIIGAPLGVSLLGVSGLLVAIGNDCDGVETFKAECRIASDSCKVGATLATVAGILAALSIIGLAGPAETLAAIAVLLGALDGIFDALAKGRAPNLDDIATVFDVAAQFSNDDDASSKLSDTSDFLNVAAEDGGSVPVFSANDYLQALDRAVLGNAADGAHADVIDGAAALLAHVPAPAAVRTKANGFLSGWRAKGEPLNFYVVASIYSVARPIPRNVFDNFAERSNDTPPPGTIVHLTPYETGVVHHGIGKGSRALKEAARAVAKEKTANRLDFEARKAAAREVADAKTARRMEEIARTGAGAMTTGDGGEVQAPSRGFFGWLKSLPMPVKVGGGVVVGGGAAWLIWKAVK